MSQSDFWERLKKRLVEVSNSAADFAEEQAIVGKLKFDILNLRRKIDHALHDIGSRVLEMGRTAPSSNPLKDREVTELIDMIGDLEIQVERKRKDITLVADQVRGRRKPTSPRASSPTPSRPAPESPAPKKSPVKKPAAAQKPAPKRRGRPKASSKPVAANVAPPAPAPEIVASKKSHHKKPAHKPVVVDVVPPSVPPKVADSLTIGGAELFAKPPTVGAAPARGRGRPKKVTTSEPSAPKKRGRPKKVVAADSAVPKKPGRPKKIVIDAEGSPVPKKRGRPKKVKPEE